MTLVCSNPKCKSSEQDQSDRLFTVEATVHRDGDLFVPINQTPTALFKCDYCGAPAKGGE